VPLLQAQPDGAHAARVHEMRAQVLDAQGQTYEALQAAQQVACCVFVCVGGFGRRSARAHVTGTWPSDVHLPQQPHKRAVQAVALQPRWADARITLARVQLNYGEPHLALRSYEAAAQLQPHHPALVSDLGW
jgi:cytochrome c-type biogenesis protein CcmH/NrfG